MSRIGCTVLCLVSALAASGLAASDGSDAEAYSREVARGNDLLAERKWAKAEAAFARADALLPGGCDAACQVPWAESLERLGRWEDATARYRRLIDAGTLSRPLVERSLRAYDHRQASVRGIRALRALLEAEELTTEDRVWTENELGLRLATATEGRPEHLVQAERAFRRAVEASGERAGVAQINLAEILIRQDRAIDALAVLDELVAIDDDRFADLDVLVVSTEVAERARAQGFALEEVRRERLPGTAPPAAGGVGDVTWPVKVKMVQPSYTPEARKARIQGVVIMQVRIGTDGRVYDARVLKGLPLGLDEKAIEAVYQARFEPATHNGKPVEVWFNVTFNFRIQ